jgi:hypothetical protein
MASFNYVVVIVPSVYLFYKPIQEQVFENSWNRQFVAEGSKYRGAEVIRNIKL